MSHSKIPDGYRAITRHDGIFKEEIHDTYQLKSKLAEPTVCSQCQAVYHQDRWQQGGYLLMGFAFGKIQF